VVDAEGERWVRTRPVKKPVDICGAGDSFSAGAAMALAVSGDAEASVRFGNLVASVTIMKKGIGTAAPAEVMAAGRTLGAIYERFRTSDHSHGHAAVHWDLSACDEIVLG